MESSRTSDHIAHDRPSTGNTEGYEERLRAIAKIVERYLSSFGLVDPWAAAQSAERIAAEALRSPSTQDSRRLRERAILVAKGWVESFARRMHADGPDWFFSIPSLLRRFPRTFLETGIPSQGELEAEPNAPLVPPEARCRMKPQAIEGAFAPFATALESDHAPTEDRPVSALARAALE